MNGKKLKKICQSYKVEFLCSIFSEKAVDILEKLKVDIIRFHQVNLQTFHF